ncbi:MAG: metallophosphoesterase [Clostridia bacterium]|nr:metallophosphoesterase [Clostridia bacterium]MBQ3044368.1 metallophosphoesterase [Clostridia bacterium]
MYKAWGFVRQSAIKAYLAGANAVYGITGGKKPSLLYCKCDESHKIGTDVRIVSQNDYSTSIAKFDKNGNMTDDDFVIVTSTDLHFSDDNAQNRKVVEYFIRHIKEVKPDLVILTGDVILGKFQQIEAIQFARMMEEIGVYWAAVFGNHETREDRGFYKWLLMKSFTDYEHCLCKFGPEELFGYGNYTINILGKGGRHRQTLFCFDSGRDILERDKKAYGLPDDMKGYDFLKKEQIEFYKKETDRLMKEYGHAESMMYFHIAIPEFAEVFKETEGGRYEPTGDYEVLFGEQWESVGCSPYNSGMFAAIEEKGTQTKAIFVGHDHVNDWCAIYKGVYFVYNLPGGYLYHHGTNFGLPESQWVLGVTVTTLKSDGSLDIKQRYSRIFLND